MLLATLFGLYVRVFVGPPEKEQVKAKQAIWMISQIGGGDFRVDIGFAHFST